MSTGDRSTSLGGPLQAVQSRPIPEGLGTRASSSCLNNTREVSAASSAENSESTHELLGALTNDLTALMGLHLLYKVYEWTVEGSSWLAHRCLAIDLGCAVAKSIDLVADRIVGLGGIPVPDLGDQTFRSRWKAGSIVPRLPQEMLAASLQTERKIVETLDEHRELARACQDYLTDDVLSHLHAKHARHIEDLLSAKVEGLDPYDRRPE